MTTKFTAVRALAVVLAAGAAVLPSGADAQEMRYAERIVYGGFKCDRIQKDSVVRPANEIAILVTVSELDSGRTVQRTFPSPGGHYGNIKAGSIRFTSQPVWEGPPQSLDVNVVMIEVDGGDAQLRGTTQAAFQVIQAAYSRGRTPGPAVDARRRGGNPVADLVARGLGRIFGTGNDLVGHATMHVNDDAHNGYWWESQATNYSYIDDRGRQRARVRYHFKTDHRRGGADCSVYFQFQRGAVLGYDTAGQPPSAGPPPPPPSPPRPDPRESRFSGPSGIHDLGGTEYRCTIDRREYHLKGSSAIAYAADGSYTRPGRIWNARDTLCHFQIDIYGDGGGEYCVGDLGKVMLGDADGPRRGTCWICEGNECPP